MSRRLRLVLMIAIVAFQADALTAAEGNGAAQANAIAATVSTARRTADEQLAQVRARISDERAALMATLQDAQRGTQAERERLRTAVKARDEAVADLRKRKQDHAQELTLLRSLADRAVVVAKLPDEQARALSRAAPAQRVAAAITALAKRAAALPDLLAARLASEPVIARDGSLRPVPVLRLGQARGIALGDEAALRGLLTRAGDGTSWLVAGPALMPAVAGTMPSSVAIDPDHTLATRGAMQERTFAAWLKGGRFFIWPILAVFAIGLLVALERAVVLLSSRFDPRRMLRIAEMLHRGDDAGAVTTVAGKRNPLDRVLAAGIAARHLPRENREAVLDQALLAEAPRLQRGLAAILVMAGIAPLLGLLGTVTGMIDMFGVIAQQGTGSAKSLSGAISEALICTQAGMIAAIPLLLLHAVLARISERRLLLLEEAACGLLGLAEHGGSTSGSIGGTAPEAAIDVPALAGGRT